MLRRNGNLFYPLSQKSLPEGNLPTLETNLGCLWLNETIVLWNSCVSKPECSTLSTALKMCFMFLITLHVFVFVFKVPAPGT